MSSRYLNSQNGLLDPKLALECHLDPKLILTSRYSNTQNILFLDNGFYCFYRKHIIFVHCPDTQHTCTRITSYLLTQNPINTPKVLARTDRNESPRDAPDVEHVWPVSKLAWLFPSAAPQKPRTSLWEGPYQGWWTKGCFGISMPPRTSSNVIETQEKHQLEFGNEMGLDIKIKVLVFDLTWLPSISVILHIYIVVKLSPIRNKIYYKFCVEIQLPLRLHRPKSVC